MLENQSLRIKKTGTKTNNISKKITENGLNQARKSMTPKISSKTVSIVKNHEENRSSTPSQCEIQKLPIQNIRASPTKSYQLTENSQVTNINDLSDYQAIAISKKPKCI